LLLVAEERKLDGGFGVHPETSIHQIYRNRLQLGIDRPAAIGPTLKPTVQSAPVLLRASGFDQDVRGGSIRPKCQPVRPVWIEKETMHIGQEQEIKFVIC
jgi:hypothetical protein